MNCELSEERLSAYADGELSGLERRSAEIHLSDCTRCANRVRIIEEIKSSLMKLPQPAMPADFREALLAEARKVDALSFSRGLRPESLFKVLLRAARDWADSLAGRFTVGAAAVGTACLVFSLTNSGDNPSAGSVPIDVMLSAHGEYARSVNLQTAGISGSVAPTPLGGLETGDE